MFSKSTSLKFAGALFVALTLNLPARADQQLVLERIVVVERHGVRSPTKSPQALAPWADKAWPQWPVGVADLTPHGAEGVGLVAKSIRASAVESGLLPASGCPAKGAVAVWADGGDQRTRESGAVMARQFAPDCGIAADYAQGVGEDPVFNALNGTCKLDPAATMAAVNEAVGPEGIVDQRTQQSLAALQTIMAPQACEAGSTGKGECLSGPSKLSASVDGLKIQGPLSTASTASEIFLLEYAQGFPMDQVGWGRIADKAGLAAVLPAHERASELTRRLPYIAQRRGGVLASLIVRTLAGQTEGLTAPGIIPAVKIMGFAGHDTNLANLAGIFGLEWKLPDQPDSTAPATALAFELWRNTEGQKFVRPVLWYLPLDQLRNLSPEGAQRRQLTFGICATTGARLCSLETLTAQISAIVPKECRRD
jgi:4-phytase/acid phosphatase